jgi:dolichyl-phosphate-mannose-protein mannosyltransferase
MNFFKKFAELQLLMLQHNAGLTASHPYASSPINWPFLISGISFWTQNEGQKQIYMIGNILGWWTCVIALSIYVGILGADVLARRRNIEPIPGGAYLSVVTFSNRGITCILQRSETDCTIQPAFSC